ncbi:hypothetical protein KGA66_22470 [Actinocrinis puniceicyclus]|uniref:Uncharacterized protein n=1 Tax=Actinocrinis puniceicyclus TaxID=977794 RepID=A0A8J7WNT0_9ACTN|nr:hypothetical protein [Actinocrinis puniceicyclus]MBS2965833.1 hypothetical protein [Actinocrinis puniceicyclus]
MDSFADPPFDWSKLSDGVRLGNLEGHAAVSATANSPQPLIGWFKEYYEGHKIQVPGGALEGSIELTCGPDPKIRESSNGERFFRVAKHDTAQCSIVMSLSGIIGCSWVDEFHPLFDSIGKFVEDCAAWNDHRGWTYVATVDGPEKELISLFGDFRLDRGASGDLSKWWIRQDIAIVSHPYLNPSRGGGKKVTLLALDLECAESAYRVIKTRPSEGSVSPAFINRTVG